MEVCKVRLIPLISSQLGYTSNTTNYLDSTEKLILLLQGV